MLFWRIRREKKKEQLSWIIKILFCYQLLVKRAAVGWQVETVSLFVEQGHITIIALEYARLALRA